MRISALLFTLTVGLLAFSGAFAQAKHEQPDEADESAETSSQAAQPAPGQEMAHWFGKAAEAYREKDIEAWVEATEELHRLRPYNQDFMRHMVEGHARLGNLRQAYDMMLTMQQQGLSENWDEIDAVEPLRGHDLYDHLSGMMRDAGEPFGDVSVWSTLNPDYAMPEAMAANDDGRIFVGTVRDGMILASDDGDEWETFATPGDVPELQAVFDLAIDAQRGHLWVATGSVSQFQGEPREDDVRSALLRMDLETGELQAEYPISSGSGRNLIGSLAIAGDGTVFAADTQSPVVYRLEPGGDELQHFFGHPNFTSLRGLALNDDGSLLYLADYELGIFVVDATGGKQAWKLAVPETFNAGGIDGLFHWDGHLVAIQNAISPQRVVRLELDPKGLGVEGVAPLAAAREEFDTPTFGVMDESNLYFLAVSHWRHVDAEGNPRATLPEVPIMKIDVDNASVQNVGREMLEELKRRQSEKQQSNED